VRQLRQNVHADAFQFETQARGQALLSNVKEGIDADRRASMADPAGGLARLGQRLALIETLEVAPQQRALLTAEAKASITADTAEGFISQPGGAVAWLERTGMRSSKVAGGKDGFRKEDAAERVARDPLLSAMTPEALSRSIDRASMIVARQEAERQAEAERRARLAEMAARKKEREADQAWNILSERARSGVATAPGEDAKLFRAIEGTPYAAEYQRLAKLIPERQALAMLPLAQQQAQIDTLTAQRNQTGTSQSLDAELKFRNEVRDATARAYKEDALGATQQYGIQNIAQIDTSTMQGLLQTIGPRVPQAEEAARIKGEPVAPLRPDEADQFGRMLAVMPVDQRSTAVARLAQKIGAKQAAALGRQIAPKDQALGPALSLSGAKTTEGRYASELVFRGAQAIKDKTVAPDTTRDSGWRKEIAELIGDAYLNEEVRQATIEAAYLVRAGLEAEGRGNNRQAVMLATGGIMERGGKKVPLPYGVTANDFDKKLRALTPEALSAQAPNGLVYVGATPMPLAEFVSAVPDAQLIHAGQGRYAVSAGGAVVTNANRRPIVIEVR
jgi:hypothetical protein